MSSNSTDIARVFTPTNINIENICSSFISNDDNIPSIIITPSESVYYIICNPNNHSSYELYKKYTNRNYRYEFFVPNYELCRLLVSINDIEDKILRSICNNFWNKSKNPDTISIKLKSSSYINPELLSYKSKNEHITLTYSNNNIIKKLQEYSMMPLLAQILYINDVPCSHYDQFIDYYEDKNLIIIKQEEICDRCCIPTEIYIENNKIWILNMGIISKNDIEEALEKDGITDIVVQYSDSIKLLSTIEPVIKMPINKSIYLLRWFHNDIETPKNILDELKDKISDYFSNLLFVDFNKRNQSIIKYCGGYVDISEHGNIIEGIKNLYYIIHAATKINNIKKIVFYDAYSYHNLDTNNLYNTLYNMILLYTGHNELLIPIEYIPTEYVTKYVENSCDCMECVD
jgi:tRNA A37 threonylcarbamoyladenosine synthetase subunit TsaC/SUA5/YrdC